MSWPAELRRCRDSASPEHGRATPGGARSAPRRGASFLNPVRDGGPGEPPQVPVPPAELPDRYWVNEETRWGYFPWGDHQGNRAIACIAYLDGKRPSAIMGRGYYARATVAAYSLEGAVLVLGDTFDSETYPDPEPYHHKGGQTITVSDVDLDGKDEIVFGALILEDDLSPRNVAGTWFPFPVPEPNVNLTQQMHNPDADDRFNYLGHGDAFHVGDFNPGIPGPEIFLTAEQPADFHSLGPGGAVVSATARARRSTTRGRGGAGGLGSMLAAAGPHPSSLSVASEGSVYNQAPHPGFFLDDDTATYPLPAQRTDIDVSRVAPLD